MATVENQTGNFLHVSYDTSKIFIWSNRYISGTFKNSTGAIASFAPGLVVARDNSDNTIVPWDDAAAANGDDQPLGILKTQITDLAIAGTITDIEVCHKGDVAEEKISFQAADDMDTVITGGVTLRDALLRMGVNPITGTELTAADNS